MKIANIYDKQLQVIEEAEEKVRIAKTNLLEAEKELDETLELVEAELKLNEDSISTNTYGIKVFTGKTNKYRWATRLEDDGEMHLQNGEIVEFQNEAEVRASDEYHYLEEHADELNWTFEIAQAAN